MRPRVLVSVLHWCDAGQTAACLEAVGEAAAGCAEVADVEVLLIDNAAVDGSGPELVGRFPRIRHRASGENLGYAGGHALALPVLDDCAADALLLVNSDARLDRAAIAALCTAWREGGAALYLAAEVLDSTGGRRRLRFPERFLDASARPHAWFGPRSDTIRIAAAATAPIRVATAFGSVVLIPHVLIARHGFLDPSWFLYGEEVDYGLRLRAAGAPTFLVPDAIAHHAGRGSSRAQPAVAALLAYYRQRNELELAWRFGSLPLLGWIGAKKLLVALSATLAWRPEARWVWRALRDGLRRRSGRVYRPEDAWRNGESRSAAATEAPRPPDEGDPSANP